MNTDLARLSMAEELWLWRLRQPVEQRPDSKYRRGEMTRAEAAKFLGMSLERYKNLEAGRRINVAADELPSLAFLRMPRPEMSLREQCILARRRSGLYIRQIAEEYGLSHTRVLAHEDMASRRLIDYWSSKGFYGWALPPETIPRPVRPRLIKHRPVRVATPPVMPPVVPETVVRPILPRPLLLKRDVPPPPPPAHPMRPVLLRRGA
jgi:DNA-binding CsgD family transcriptional regulator